MIRLSVCVFFLSLFPLISPGQKVTFELFTTAEGLTSNESQHLVQDDRGFIWFLNASRIYRYDGRKFKQYPSPPGLISGSEELLSSIKLYQDSLLFITGEKHAFLLNPHTEDWKSFNLAKSPGDKITFKKIGAINSDKIIIQTYSSFSAKSIFWRLLEGKLDSFAIQETIIQNADLQQDEENIFFLHEKGELKKLDQQGRLLGLIPIRKNTEVPISIRSYKQLKHTFYFNTSAGLFTLSPEADSLIPHPVNDLVPDFVINDYQAMENGDIWITGAFRNLYQYVSKEEKLYSHEETLSQVFPYKSPLKDIFKDQTGILWVRTQLGLLKIIPQGNLFYTYMSEEDPSCIGFCSFRGITEDQEGMIYASYYSGIVKINRSNTTIESIIPGYIPFGLELEENKLMLYSGKTFDLEAQSYASPGGISGKEGVYTRDQQGQLWLAIDNRLKRLDKSGAKWTWESITNFQNPGVNCLHMGKKSGLIWRGASGELASYSVAEKTMRSIKTRSLEIPFSQILSIYENPEGHLWLATDVGLILYDPTTKQILQHYSSEDGLPNDYVASMLAEGDTCLWLGTNNGLSRFQIQEKSFINFFTDDGLTHNEFNRVSYYQAKDGQMFFGGLRGLNAFYPQEVIQNYRIKNEPAQVVLTAFEHMDERADSLISSTFFSKNPIFKLHHWERSFTFEYALTDFSNPSEVFYSYKMEGYEDNWSKPSPFNFTRFSSLPAGDYTFRVKARDSHGMWHPHELKITVSVLPPWWATWWAYLGYVLIIIGLLLGILFFLRRRWMLQNQLILEQTEGLRLKELDGFKSRLYTNLTHEFRTPLTVILGMTDELEQVTDQAIKDEKVKKGFQLIRRNGKDLLRLINQLLDLSKLEDNSLKLQPIQADIVNFIAYLKASFEALANSRNLSLRYLPEQEALEMDFDPDQLTQVFTNLISNAIKFTPSGGKVVVRLGRKEESLILEVEDSGKGIAEKDLPHIFNRFFQADASSTRSGDGTGIGLAHTKELVKLMDGEITVVSQLGKGSCFRLSLPISHLAPKQTLDRTAQHIPVARQAKSSPQTSGELQHLLIIEDNPDVVTYLSSCLEALYEIDVAYNGSIGIEKAFENIPDLIISDVMMPEKDGFEVCYNLKHDERTSHIPIILLTAKADQESVLRGLRQGADAYLAKPFHKEELLVRLEKLLALRQQLQERYAGWVQKAEVATDQLAGGQSIEDVFLQKVRSLIEKELSNSEFNPGMMSQELGLSSSQLYRKMKALTGTTPALFVRSFRLQKAKELLKTTDLNVSEIAYQVGFSSPSFFSRAFSEAFGSPPNENRL